MVKMEKMFIKIGTRIVNVNMITDICFSTDYKICNVYMCNENHALEFDVADGEKLINYLWNTHKMTVLRE